MKKSKMELLKEYGWIYIIFIIIAIGCVVVVEVIPDVFDKIKPYIDTNGTDIDPKIYFYITLGVYALLDLWYFVLLRRFVAGKSKGNLYAFLLFLGVAGGVVGFIFMKEKISTFNFFVDLCGLIFLLMAKKEVKDSGQKRVL